MRYSLKPLKDQTLFITGATSGIGLTTARLAGKRGARLLLVSRSEPELRQLVEEIEAQGGQATYAVADVADEAELRSAAETAKYRFGGIDTWVNNAGVSIYGPMLDVPMEDHRRLFETNFWGVVIGSRLAVEVLHERGGALINMGSVLSDRAVPVQGMYCASKHAVKGFTDALRMELEEAGLPISVTLIKPSAIDTPYNEHAKNYLPVEPQNPPPFYAPEIVAEAILYAAEHPERDILVGGGGAMLSTLGKVAPRLMDLAMEATMFKGQEKGTPAMVHRDGISGPSSELRERGGYEGHVIERSLYTKAALHPVLTGAAVLGAGLGLAAWWGV